MAARKSLVSAHTRATPAEVRDLATLPGASQSTLPNRHRKSHQEAPMSTKCLIDFATDAAVALREQAAQLFDSTHLNFFLDLKIRLTNVEKRLRSIEPPKEARIISLLCALERLARWRNERTIFAEPILKSHRNSYSRLVKVVDENAELARVGLKRLAQDQSLPATKDRKKFQKTFDHFSNTKDEQPGPTVAELSKPSDLRRALYDETTECLRSLHEILCQFCGSTAPNDGIEYMANIGLNTITKNPHDDSITTHMFLLHKHGEQSTRSLEWKEAYMRVYPERLFDEGIELPDNELRFELRAPSVPLTRILSSASLKQDRERKMLLSYFLAKAVWQFYDSDWMATSWTKDTVHFMRCLQRRDALDHRPFFSTGFGPPKEAATQNAGKSHKYPKILALGIMLLEIELGDGIEKHIKDVHLDKDRNERPNARHAAAGTFITTQKWLNRPRIYKPVREAIETCIKPDTTKLGQDETQVRANLYKYVVAPFSGLFEMMWELPPEQQDLGPLTFEGNGTFLSQVEQDCAKGDAARSSIPGPLEPPRANPTDHAALLSSASSVNDSHTWLSKFDIAVLKLFKLAKSNNSAQNHLPSLPMVLESGHYCNVKVAILDTGCNINHKFFSGPGESQRDNLEDRWFDCVDDLDDPVDEDEDQHGTALVALMLRLVPGAKLYVLRVAKNKAGLAAARPAIVQAIDQAVRKWKVDIVSMSFGFSDDVKIIQDEITDAAKDHNVLFFAAANNDGKNEPELFPAFMESVISVRGTDHEGAFVPRYNPDSWQHKPGPQYGSLAQEVPWEWKSNSLTKSGCSFATPIVAATAALIIAFADNERTLADYRHLVRTRRGMLAVFSGMTSKSLDPLRRYLAPWQLFEGNRNPAFEIGQALTSIP